MKLFRFNPTIKEANKYLSKTTDALSKKHGGVSNEEFETELIKITGIGWKQVKNYKNHPKPSERIKDNAVVLKYLREQQANDIFLKIRHRLTYAAIVFLIISAIYYLSNLPRKESLIIYQNSPKSIASRELISDFNLTVPSVDKTFSIGVTDLNFDNFNCSVVETNEKMCTLENKNNQLSIRINTNTVTQFNLMLLDIKDAVDIDSQIKRYLKKHSIAPTIISGPIEKFKFETKSESIEVIKTLGKPNMRPMLTVSVVIKL